MALEVGSRLGHDDVTALRGDGGVGQVYQATETKLRRQVALWRMRGRARCWTVVAVACLSVVPLGCADPGSDPTVLTADVPLHLEAHLDAAVIEGSAVPSHLPEPVEWRFDEPQPSWTVAASFNPGFAPASLSRTEDAVRVTLGAHRDGSLVAGGLEVDLPEWRLEDWEHVVLRARTTGVRDIQIGFNRRADASLDNPFPFRSQGDEVAAVGDGVIHTYVLRAYPRWQSYEGPLRDLGFWFTADEAASIDILSVSLIPKEANYSDLPAGTRPEIRGRVYRSGLYAHAPGRLAWQVRIPEGGSLDLGLGVLRDDVPVTFRVTATGEGGERGNLFEETYADQERWAQRSVDLSALAGRTVTLALEAEAERAGTVALWGAPTLSGDRTTNQPNVIFYVIDGGGADFMSVYGYERRTTPTMERLAAEGVVFEQAYSNSSWTRPSTASFMTSLHNSVIGGDLTWDDAVPEQAMTMAEHMHRAGYHTAVFTANPNAGTMSHLHRGVDLFREDFDWFKESSRFLHEGFWSWREVSPIEPYWAHIQTTDVHDDFPAVAPFAGLFVGPADLARWEQWSERGAYFPYAEVYGREGISRTAFFSIKQGLYDETMAHNDYQLGRLVDRLKAQGEWENTLLIIGADHSIKAAAADMGIGLSATLPPRWEEPMFRPTTSRVPLIFVWPGKIDGGRRLAQPVSMIDVLPTLLDLVGLPPAEVAQGQSLAPLLLGTDGWEPRPVILDEFEADRETGELRGLIEVIDGRWGASLEINATPHPFVMGAGRGEGRNAGRRPAPLLLFDLWNDPMCLHSVHDEHPALVGKYTKVLEEQFEAHQILAQQFTRGERSPMTAEQLRALRTLGYIR